MSAVRIISAQQNLISEVASHLQSDQRDYSSSVVVFPGKRPAHFLRKELARREHGALIPPQIFSFDLFVEHLFRETLGMSEKSLDLMDAVAILFDIHRDLATRLGQDVYTSLDHFFPLALRLIPELEEVSLTDATERKIRELLQPIDIPKFHALADYYEEFYRKIGERGGVTRSMTTRRVADRLSEIDLTPYRSVILAGFYAFTAAEGRIIRRLLEQENVTMIAQSGPGLNSQLAQLGIDVSQPEEEKNHSAPLIHYYKTPDVHGQVAILSGLLEERNRRNETMDERSVIVLPDSGALFPTYHGALSLFEEGEFNIALGYPLERTPICGLITTLLELAAVARDGLFTPALYLRFALHPYMKSVRLKNRADVTRIMMHAIESQLSEYALGALFHLEDLEEHAGVHKSTISAVRSVDPQITADEVRTHLREIHNNTIRRFLTCESIGKFASNCIDVVSFIFNESTARFHPLFQPYAQEMITIFERMGDSLLKDHRFTDPQQYLAFFRSVVKGETVPFAGTPLKGLQVLGLLETRNLQFDTIYFLDANDDIIPGKPGLDMLLPQKIRRMLGLETHTERERLKEYYFSLALNGAREVHLFYAESEGGRSEKSRFVEKLLWEDQRQRKNTEPSEREHTAHYRVNLTNPVPEPVRKTEAMIAYLRHEHHFSAHQLDDYLHCPLRFYYRNVLHVREKDEAGDEIDRRLIGNFVHEVLKAFYLPTSHGALRNDHLGIDRLEGTIGNVSREFFGGTIPIPIQLALRQVTRQLRSFIERHQMPLISAEEVVVQALEEKLQVEKNGYRFAGRIDRIETRDGRVFILDYKTGKDQKKSVINPDKIDPDDTSTWQDGVGSFQLPLYVLLYAVKHSVDPEKINPRYLFLGKNEIDPLIESGMSIEGNADSVIYRAIEPLMFRMVDEIADIEREFYRTSNMAANCPSCPYTSICGTQWVKKWDN